jgi:hypothetical protein
MMDNDCNTIQFVIINVFNFGENPKINIVLRLGTDTPTA